jgi:hypothetical protein
MLPRVSFSTYGVDLGKFRTLRNKLEAPYVGLSAVSFDMQEQ